MAYQAELDCLPFHGKVQPPKSQVIGIHWHGCLIQQDLNHLTAVFYLGFIFDLGQQPGQSLLFKAAVYGIKVTCVVHITLEGKTAKDVVSKFSGHTHVPVVCN